MIDFGLLPCPLCGGEPEVARLTQGPEELTAVIKCTSCGLTLEWETEITVIVFRSGQRITKKTSLDPIEAWNQRRMCDNCGVKVHSEQVAELPNCNDCGAKRDCEYIPLPPMDTRGKGGVDHVWKKEKRADHGGPVSISQPAGPK